MSKATSKKVFVIGENHLTGLVQELKKQGFNVLHLKNASEVIEAVEEQKKTDFDLLFIETFTNIGRLDFSGKENFIPNCGGAFVIKRLQPLMPKTSFFLFGGETQGMIRRHTDRVRFLPSEPLMSPHKVAEIAKAA